MRAAPRRRRRCAAARASGCAARPPTAARAAALAQVRQRLVEPVHARQQHADGSAEGGGVRRAARVRALASSSARSAAPALRSRSAATSRSCSSRGCRSIASFELPHRIAVPRRAASAARASCECSAASAGQRRSACTEHRLRLFAASRRAQLRAPDALTTAANPRPRGASASSSASAVASCPCCSSNSARVEPQRARIGVMLQRDFDSRNAPRPSVAYLHSLRSDSRQASTATSLSEIDARLRPSPAATSPLDASETMSLQLGRGPGCGVIARVRFSSMARHFMACRDMRPGSNYWKNGSCLYARSRYTPKKF